MAQDRETHLRMDELLGMWHSLPGTPGDKLARHAALAESFRLALGYYASHPEADRTASAAADMLRSPAAKAGWSASPARIKACLELRRAIMALCAEEDARIARRLAG